MKNVSKKTLLLFLALIYSVSIIKAADAVFTLYTENFENTGSDPAGWTPDAEWIIDNGNAIPVSSGYAGASGGYGYIASNSGSFTYYLTYDNNFATTNYSPIDVTWGAYKQSGFVAPITFEYSTDGATWTAVAFTDVNNDDTWALVNTVTLPADASGTANLRLRWSYTGDSNGFLYGIDDVFVSGTATNFYSLATGNLDVNTNWGTNTDGTGFNPDVAFTYDNVNYNIVNNATPTIGANWSIAGGTNTKIIIGDGITPTDFTIPATNTFTGRIDFSSTGTLTVQNLTVSTFTFSPIILTTGSTVNFAGAGAQSIVANGAVTYSNLTISGSGEKTCGAVNATVNGILNLSAGSLQLPTNSVRILTLNGGIMGTGTISGTALGRLAIGAVGVTLNFTPGFETFRALNLTSASTVILGTNITISTSLDLQNVNSILDLNNQTLTLNGLVTINTGKIRGSSTSNISIGGTAALGTLRFDQTSAATRTLNNFTLNRGGGSPSATLGNALEVVGEVTLSNGTLNTGGFLTLKCSSGACARIAALAGTGAISGNVTVERFSPGTYTGWGLLGSPITSSISSWDDDIVLTCSDCPDGYPGGFTSIYTYNEAATGSYASGSSYVPIPNYATAITNGRGYYVYYGTGGTVTSDIVFDVTGTVATNAIPLAPTYNDDVAAPASDDGWNLLANPYPSPISWSALEAAASAVGNIDDDIYVFNADLGGPGVGGYATYNKTTLMSSPLVGSGGIDDNIPMGQGFFVHLIGATSLTAQEAHKVSGNPTFRKTNPTPQSFPYMRLKLNGAGRNDESVVMFYPNATDSFDSEYDAYKLFGSNPSAAYIATMKNNVRYVIDAMPPLTQNISVPVMVKVGISGTYTISEENISSMPGSCINLYDKLTGTTTDLRTSSYTFTILDTTVAPRFLLNISMSSALSYNDSVNHPTCLGSNNGLIVATPANSGPWNYTWKDSSGVVIKTSLNKSTADSLNNLLAGNYSVEINTVGMCDFATPTFVLNDPAVAQAAFTSNTDTAYLSNGGTVNFTNTSSNGNGYLWDFGDGSGTSNSVSPSHAYTSEGTYTVTLVSYNTPCSGSDTALYVVEVLSVPIGTNILLQTTADNAMFFGQDQNGTYVRFNYAQKNNAVIRTNNILGQKVMDDISVQALNQTIYLNSSAIKNRILFITVVTEDSKTTQKIFQK